MNSSLAKMRARCCCRFRQIKWTALGLGLLCIAMAPLSTAKQLQIKDFQPNQLSAAELQQVCEQLVNGCRAKADLKTLKINANQLWIMKTAQVAEFRWHNQRWQLLHSWQLFDPEYYNGDTTLSESLYPKLFQIDQDQYAVAVIVRYRDWYSQDSTTFEKIDLYQLTKTQAKPLVFGYPFGLHRRTPTCLQLEQSQQAKYDCHDEEKLSLQIRVLKPMLWRFDYLYSLHKSANSANQMKAGQRNYQFDIDLNAPTPPELPFLDEWF